MPQVTIDWPTNTIIDSMVSGSADIGAAKQIRHQSLDFELFAPGTTITALTKLIHVVRASIGTVVGFEAAITTVATGADRTVNVDLQRSTGGGAFATIASSTILFNNVSTVRTAVAGVLTTSPSPLVDGDILQLVVTVAGAAGAQAAGLIVTVTGTEKYT